EGFGDRIAERHEPTVTDPCPEKIAAQVVPSLGEVEHEPVPVRGMCAAGERRERHQQECEREEHTEGELETARHPGPLPYPVVCRHGRWRPPPKSLTHDRADRFPSAQAGGVKVRSWAAY